MLAAERNGEKIAVEIKSFLGKSTVNDLENAVGQYGIYAGALEEVEPDWKLYLAISGAVYDELAQMKAFTMIVKRYRIALIIVALKKEEIIQWIP